MISRSFIATSQLELTSSFRQLEIMKRRDILCVTPSSTAVCTGPQDRPSTIRLGTKSMEKSISKPSTPSREIPFSPRLLLEKFRKSSADIREWASSKKAEFGRRSFAAVNDVRSPSSSSRQLLREAPRLDLVPTSQTPKPRRKPEFDFDRSSSLVVKETPRRTSNYIPSRRTSAAVASKEGNCKELVSLKPSSQVANREIQPMQVVVLKVSIHCKGCAGKVRKHIAKMEGVSSFNIDMENKKVTVVGDVTPSKVLESISKVKKAQLWPSSSSTHDSFPRWSSSYAIP